MRRRTFIIFVGAAISVTVLLILFSQLSFNSAEEDTIERCRDTNYEYDICPEGMLTCMSQSSRCQTYLDQRCPDPCIVRSYYEDCSGSLVCQDNSGDWHEGGLEGYCKIKCEDPPSEVVNGGDQ